jgi:phenylacetate-CoA ligase
MTGPIATTLPRSRAEIEVIQRARKVEAVRQAMRAEFYRGKLDHIDLSQLDDPAEWAKVPLLDKDMLRGITDDEFYRDFCLPPARGHHIAQYWRSGGATGRPLFYPRSDIDIEVAMRGFARVYACAGGAPPQNVHCAFPLGIHPVGLMMARAAEFTGFGTLMAGAGTTTPSALQIELIDRLRPDIFVGMSSYALHLANLADQSGVNLCEGSVRLMICSAEPLSAAKREKLRRMWGATVRDSFGMTEAGMMGCEDGQAEGFRVWSDLFLVEVLDAQTRLPVPDGEVGALVVTPLFTNTITPFLRWMSGDMVTLRHDAPGDGPFSIFPVLRHAHRTSGFFKIRGININHGEFEDFMFSLSSINDFKCEALTRGDLDVLRVCIELKRGVEIRDETAMVEREIKRVFEITSEVEVLERGTLAREFEAAIKAPRMRDLR